MKILAIETSCDDTCASVVKETNGCFSVLSNVVSSQVKLHAKYGGVFPSLAKREHQKNLAPVLKQALIEAKLLKKIQKSKCKSPSISAGRQNCNPKFKNLETILSRETILLPGLKLFLENYQKPKIDAIAVTVGPGLEPCLWVGVNFAKALAYYWDLPIIPANHIESHILANFLRKELSSLHAGSLAPFTFPAIALIVSGGHTQLILMKKLGQYKIIGETRDDAAGECFDKTARLLGLAYPGGPAIAAEAAKFKAQSASWRTKFKVALPRPMIYSKDYDFSFSGLKTAVLYQIRKDGRKAKSKTYIQQMCYEIQQSIIDVLIAKTIKAAKDYRVKTIMLGGGVASNYELRQQFKVKSSKLKVDILIPERNLCTDNAAMAGITGYYHFKEKTMGWEKIEAKANFHL